MNFRVVAWGYDINLWIVPRSVKRMFEFGWCSQLKAVDLNILGFVLIIIGPWRHLSGIR